VPSVLEELKEVMSIATGDKVLVPLAQGAGIVSEIFTLTPVALKRLFSMVLLSTRLSLGKK
jgi:hypothetical protein